MEQIAIRGGTVFRAPIQAFSALGTFQNMLQMSQVPGAVAEQSFVGWTFMSVA